MMDNIVAAASSVSVNVVFAGTALLLVRRLFEDDGGVLLLVHALILCWTCVVANSLMLGVMGLLRPCLLMGAVFLSCLLALAVMWATTDDRVCKAGRRRKVHATVWTVVWAFLAVWLAARVIVDGLLEFPTDVDTLMYHLPLVDHWIRDATLYVPDCPFWYVPGNNELWVLWLVGPFSGDFLWALANVPAIVLLAGSALELAKSLQISRWLAHAAALAIVATQVTWRQAVSVENDVAVGALFLTTLLYAVRFARYGRWTDVVFGSLAFGLLSGVKYYALGYAGVAGITLIAAVAYRSGWRAVLRAGTIGFLALATLGAYWYVRNVAATGTPFYPKGLSRSTDLWKQMRPEAGTSTLAGSRRPEVWRMLADAIHRQGGACHLAAVGLLPATVAWLGVSLFGTRAPAHRRILDAALLLPMTFSAVVYVTTPNVVETVPGTMNMLRSEYHPIRFGLCFLSLVVLALAVVTDRVLLELAATVAVQRSAQHGPRTGTGPMGHRGLWRISELARHAIAGIWATALLYQLLSHIWTKGRVDHLLLALSAFLIMVVFRVLRRGRLPWKRSAAKVMIVFGLVSCVWVPWQLAVRWHGGFVEYYDANLFESPVISTLKALGPGHHRVCSFYNRYYPLFG